MTSLFSALTGWTLFGGLILATGAIASRWLTLPRAFSGEDSSFHGHLMAVAHVGIAGSTLVIIGLGLYFVRQLLEFRDPFVPWKEDAALLLHGTAWGTRWMTAVAGSVFALAAFRLAGNGRAGAWWVATPLVLALGTFPGFTGHAAGAEQFKALSLLSDATHVWAAGAWIGGLAVILTLERGERHRSEGRASLLAHLVPAFSPVAMASVGAIILTGAFASWSHLPSVGALFATGYGRALLIKLTIVAVVLGLGARNFQIVTPRLGTLDGDDAMRRSATTELLIAQLVLITTAVLIRTSPIEP